MRVLVTGAAGFIGSHLCEELGQRGFDVVGVDNFDPFYDRAIKMGNVDIIRGAGTDFRELDLRDRAGLSSLVDVARPEVIVHLAAKAGVRNSIKFPHQCVESNLNATQNVMDAALENDVERLVLASTSSVYGNTERIPFSEDDPACEPLQPYSASKRAAEMLAGTYHHLYGLQTTVTRFFTVYGPRGRPDMMPPMLARSIKHGDPVPLFAGELARDWTYVSDVCAGLVAAAERPLGFEILNLGRGEPVLLAEFIAALERTAGARANLVPVERPASEMLTTWADIAKASTLLDFTPLVSVEEGVQELWAWYESQGATP